MEQRNWDPDDGERRGNSGARPGPIGWIWIVAVAAGVVALIGYLWSAHPGAIDPDGDAPRLVYLMLLLAALGAGFLFRSAIRLRETLKHAAIWVVVALALLVGYSFRDTLTAVKDRVAGELFPQSGEMRGGEIVYRRASDGHFHIDAAVNGATVRFMVDTGATSIVLTKADARRIGFDPGRLRYTSVSSTANGIVYGAPVRLDTLRIGPVSLRDVPATVNDGEMFGSLLGLQFLDRLSGYEVRGDQLILRP